MYRVVLIDDDKWALADMERCFHFNRYGFTVSERFRNAEDALVSILTDPPDLIVSDICMEHVSGLDMARVLREHKLQSLVVLVSGYDNFSYVQEAFRWNVFQYLLKPLEDDKVEQVMRRAVAALENSDPGAARTVEKPVKEAGMDPVSRAIAIVDERYAEMDLHLEAIADELFISKSYLSELFKHATGMTFTDYKNDLRVRRAQAMMREGKRNLTEIAQATGFDSGSYFTRIFKQYTGTTPQAWRKENQVSEE